MNAIFSFIMIVSLFVITIFCPDKLLSAFSTSANKTISLSINLLAIYIIWCGFSELLQKSGLNKKIAKLLRPITRFLFGKTSEETSDLISLNLSCNLLGLGGIATPVAIDAMKNLENEKNNDAKTMLFVISATSIQILPTSVMQLLAENGCLNSYYVIVPTLISTIISTVLGVTLCKVLK